VNTWRTYAMSKSDAMVSYVRQCDTCGVAASYATDDIDLHNDYQCCFCESGTVEVQPVADSPSLDNWSNDTLASTLRRAVKEQSELENWIKLLHEELEQRKQAPKGQKGS
jgi:hypothetical protein